MTPFVADEDFNGAITRGLLRRGVDMLIATCSDADEWRNRVTYLPLR